MLCCFCQYPAFIYPPIIILFQQFMWFSIHIVTRRQYRSLMLMLIIKALINGEKILNLLLERPVDFSLSGGRESRASSDAPMDSDSDEIDVLGDEAPSPPQTVTLHLPRRSTSPTAFHRSSNSHPVTLTHQPQHHHVQPIQRHHHWDNVFCSTKNLHYFFK